MKNKIAIMIILVFSICIRAQTTESSLENQIDSKLFSDFITSKLIDELKKNFLNQINYFYKITRDKNISDEDNELFSDRIKLRYDLCFDSRDYKHYCQLADDLDSDARTSLYNYLGKNLTVTQEFILSKKNERIFISGTNIKFYILSVTPGFQVPKEVEIIPAAFDINGTFQELKMNTSKNSFTNGSLDVAAINDLIASKYDTYENTFISEITKIDRNQIDNKNFISFNKRKFNAFLKDSISYITKSNTFNSLECYFTNYLGNYNTRYLSNVIDSSDKEVMLLKHPRRQDAQSSTFENYSLYRISSSKKNLETYPDYNTEITVHDGKIYELFLSHPTNSFIKGIKNSFINIFESYLGEKFYTDLVRFLFGFTTSITTQDIRRLETFYHEIAIRCFLNGPSRGNNYTSNYGQKAIIKGFETLFDKLREVYVTLDESNNNPNTVIPLHKETSLKFISQDNDQRQNFRKKLAFILNFNILQKWRTLSRVTQGTKLDDSAYVNFTLLFLNMQQINNYLENGDGQQYSTDSFTVFAIRSYFYDLYKDMIESERLSLKREFPRIFEYLIDYEAAVKNGNISKQNILINKLGDTQDFYDIREELKKFFNSQFRLEVHNRKFLFNVAYIKILYQFTYSNDSDEIKIRQTLENRYYEKY